MSAIKGVLKEEIERLGMLSKKYKQEISKLPKGCISEKERKGNLYAYLAYREKDKVHFKYLGNVQSEKVEKIKKLIESRRKYESLLKKVQKDLRELKRAIYERKK